MPTPTEIAPIVTVTKFKLNPRTYISAYSHTTTKAMGTTVTTAYRKDFLVTNKRINVAPIAIGNEVCSDLVVVFLHPIFLV